MAQTRAEPTRPRVLIVGGGFGGLAVARRLRRAPADVLLLDRHNYHAFQPLLYQVATSGLPPGAIAPPLRWVLRRARNVRVLMEEVVAIDLEHSVVQTSAPGDELHEHGYDYLVVAAGARHAYFGHPEWEVDAPGLKTVEDALEIRRRILSAFERAEATIDAAERERAMTFVVVGAGPTGVELAGQIAEMARRTLRGEYRSFDPRDVRTILVDAAERPLGAYDERLSAKTARSLRSLGVELMLGAAVTGVDEQGVTVGSGEAIRRIDAGTVIWAAGVQASPLAAQLAQQSSTELDRAGRVMVDAQLRLPHHPNTFAIGDMVATGLPGIAPVAMQQGGYVADRIRDAVSGHTRAAQPFSYSDKGTMATIGRWRAVAQIGPLRVSGLLAWLMWLFVHLLYIVGFANRMVVLARWARSMLTSERGERALTRQADQL